LKRRCRTPDSWVAQVFRTLGLMPSGPSALRWSMSIVSAFLQLLTLLTLPKNINYIFQTVKNVYLLDIVYNYLN